MKVVGTFLGNLLVGAVGLFALGALVMAYFSWLSTLFDSVAPLGYWQSFALSVPLVFLVGAFGNGGKRG